MFQVTWVTATPDPMLFVGLIQPSFGDLTRINVILNFHTYLKFITILGQIVRVDLYKSQPLLNLIIVANEHYFPDFPIIYKLLNSSVQLLDI